jgi:hypothetical protein
MTKTIDHYDSLMELFGKDREKRPALEKFKSTPEKKTRKEPPQERQHTPSARKEPPNERQHTPLNGLNFTVADSSETTLNGSEVVLFWTSIIINQSYIFFVPLFLVFIC